MWRIMQLAVTIVVVMQAAIFTPAGAMAQGAFFSKTVKKGAITFVVSSRPIKGLPAYITQVAVMRGGKTFATSRADTDYTVEDAWVEDLDRDGIPELVLKGVGLDNGRQATVTVYKLTGNTLRRILLPDLSPEEQAGYRGGDSFRIAAGKIERTFPVYRDGDQAGNPGGAHTVRYELRGDRLVAMAPQAESPLVTPAPEAPKVATVAAAPVPVPVPAVAVVPPVAPATPVSAPPPAPAAVRISSLTAGDYVIEIKSVGRIADYKVSKQYRPGRLIIEIPGARSDAASNKVTAAFPRIAGALIVADGRGVRIVVTSTLPAFPVHSLEATDDGLLIKFPRDDSRATPVSSRETPPVAPLQQAVAGDGAERPETAKGPADAAGGAAGRVKAAPSPINPVVTAIESQESSVVIRAGSGIAKYRTIALDKPQRLVIDIPGGASELAGSKIAIGKFGVGSVRVGANRGFLRVVLDSSQAVFPEHSVTTTAEGLAVMFKAR